MNNSTIAAIATAGGRGGIGIVKMSGPRAVSIIKAVFRPCNADNNGFQSHKLNYGRIVDPQTLRVLDEVLVSVMRAPQTYTKEDVVEINAHGAQRANRFDPG
jgi:tRNA modification GTPase